jgi:hypothetical protein
MNDEYTLETLQLNLNIIYLNNLINGFSKLNINCENIKKKLSKLNNNTHDIQTYSISEQKNKIITDMTEKGITETETIDYLYLKPWSKLTQIHKIIKIKEFINNLNILDQTEKENITCKLIDQIKERKIKNKINYDDTKGKILFISNLLLENDKYILSV